VEDVLELGQAIEVKVDDIDPQGKVSLSLVGDFRSPKRTLVLLVPVTRTAVIEVTVATEAVVTVIVGRASARRARTPTIHAPARRRRPSKRPSRPNSQAKSATWALVARPSSMATPRVVVLDRVADSRSKPVLSGRVTVQHGLRAFS